MRKALSVLLICASILIIAGCDNGSAFDSNKVQSRLKVHIERLQSEIINEHLTVYAMDFRKEGRTLIFVCPCHIPGNVDSYLNVSVDGDSFKLTLLPNAEYNVKVQYWKPNADGNTEVEFHVSR